MRYGPKETPWRHSLNKYSHNEFEKFLRESLINLMAKYDVATPTEA
jgi:hypothetical protein